MVGASSHDFSSYQVWLTCIEEMELRTEVKDYLEGSMIVAWWIIWSYRNRLIFSFDAPSKAYLFDVLFFILMFGVMLELR